MHFGKRKGYLAYPILASAILFASASMRAQDASPQQQQTTDSQIQAETQAQEQTPEQRVEVLRAAQARVKARRRLRIRQIIQDTYSHQYETYFGGGYLRFRPGSSLQKNSEAGWNVGITDYLAGKLGVTADFRGYYGTTYTNVNPYQVFSPSISQYTFMAGPQARFFEGQHWAWSGFVLAGVGHGNFGTGTGGLPPTLIGLYPDGDSFNMTAGASVDYNLGPGLALRLTPNYLMSRYGGDTQNNLGFNAGIVYRFGRQK
jgi:hypothetical protein